MICESCKFENREGALFCAECGKPLGNAEQPAGKESDKTVILDEVITNSKESVENNDDSEANTTVLTSDMLKPAGQPVAPQGFAAGPAPVKPMAPAGAPMAPGAMNPQAPAGQPAQAMKPQAPAGAPMAPAMNPQAQAGQPAQAMKPQAPAGAPMAPAMNPQAPVGQPVPAMNPQAQAGQPTPAANPQVAPQSPQVAPQTPQQSQEAPKSEKPAKVDKKAAKAEKKANKGKMGTGTKVYIVISIILILAAAGAIVWGYFYHTDKMEAAKTEKEALIAEYEAKITEKDTAIANLGASELELQANITSLESQVAEAQLAQAEALAVSESYVAYDPLIDFVEAHSADSSTDMMVSDTVVSTTAGSTVEVFVYFPSQEGQLSYTVSDATKVDCAWGDEWVNGNVLPIKINALAAGDVTIEVINDQNDVKEVIFVHVQ